jgi:hypothetical protein
MTPKQQVLKAHPTAYLWRRKNGTLIKFSVKCASYPGQILAGGQTPKEAWKRAASLVSHGKAT